MHQSPSAKFWGPRRLVEVYREPRQPLGLAIVGGKVDMAGGSQGGDIVTGIFVKSVLQVILSILSILASDW